MKPRVGGRVPGALGLTAAVAVWATACGADSGDPQWVSSCVDLHRRVVVDQTYCQDVRGTYQSGTYGSYYQQLPRTHWYDDDDGSDDVVVAGVGQAPPRGGTYARPLVRNPTSVRFAPRVPAGARFATVGPARSVTGTGITAARARSSSISRGGLGVPSGRGGSSGS